MNSEILNTKEIQEILVAFATGDFSKRIEVSNREDLRDSIVLGINMLGEELEQTTISRDYFGSIYNAVSDILIVTDLNGIILDVNSSIQKRVGLQKEKIIGVNYKQFIPEGHFSFEENSSDLPSKEVSSFNFESHFVLPVEGSFPISCSISKILNRKEEHEGFLIIAKDITDKKNQEEELIKIMVSTQEKERKRLAYDLHDSLGQELNAIKMYLSTLNYMDKSNKDFETTFVKCQSMVDHSIGTIRKLAFDLMPKSLEAGNLSLALEQLCEKLKGVCNIVYDFEKEPLNLPVDTQVLIYRVFQEFISNSMKYAEATELKLVIRKEIGQLIFELRDDGVGFNEKKVKNGNGMHNIKSRLKAINASYYYGGKENQGTTLKFIIIT